MPKYLLVLLLIVMPSFIAPSGSYGRVTPLHLQLGPAYKPEINVNWLKRGPRGWLYGSTEENGYMFIIDPATRKSVVWNAGRQEPTEGGTFEGDISDFVVWEEFGSLIIVAAQAYPAQLYRYVIPIPQSGLPIVDRLEGTLVYENLTWKRVLAIETGAMADGRRMLLAGSYWNAELIVSTTRGKTWRRMEYMGGNNAFSLAHRAEFNRSAGIINIDYFNGTWFMMLKNTFLLQSETPWKTGYRHFINGVLYSTDFGTTWRLADMPRNPDLAASFMAMVDNERISGRLPPELYDLTGENLAKVVRRSDDRMFGTITMDAWPEEPFGGRIVTSGDGGRTWSHLFRFVDSRAISLATYGPTTLLVGTMTKTATPPGGVAYGDLWRSFDSGRTWTKIARVVQSDKPSSVRSNIFVVGVSDIVTTPEGIWMGTVNEGEAADVIFIPR